MAFYYQGPVPTSKRKHIDSCRIYNTLVIMHYSLFLIIAITFLSACAHIPLHTQRDRHVQATLNAEHPSIEANKPFWIGITLSMDPDWHIYWKNPGDSGTPTRITWTLPKGFRASEIYWPPPIKIEQRPLRSYGYAGQVTLLTQIDPGAHIDRSNMISAHIEWLMCKVECVPGAARLEISIPRKNAASKPNIENPLIKKALNTLPLKASDLTLSATYTLKDISIYFDGPSKTEGEYTDAYFFPERDDLIEHASVQTLSKNESGYVLSIPRSGLLTTTPTEIKGLLYTSNGWHENSSQYIEIAVPLKERQAKPVEPFAKPFLIALIFAFIGGLILNLMPCVLPVLSIKVLSLINEQADRRTFYLHGIFYTLGVVLSFIFLAGLLLLLRNAGSQLGWGFQFQSPIFLVFLALLFFILALNLFGLFEIPVVFQGGPIRHKGLIKSFLNGILITITATPCTAPFMGTALGFALTQTAPVSLSIFAFLGLGVAFPYLLLCLFPSLLRFLPKPGPWMTTLKRFLGILLLATTCWLLWILSGQLGNSKEIKIEQTSNKETIIWQDYSQELIDQYLKDQRNIFIDFTARWCLTCQVNERLALADARVVEKFKELNIAALKADWTSKDSRITQALESYGKNSIPLYVFYSNKNNGQPLLLPELITPQLILETLEKGSK